MMRTRRSNLYRPPSIRLPDNLTQIPRRHHISALEDIGNSQRQLTTQPPDHRRQIIGTQHLDPLDQARLCQRPSWNHHSPPSRPLRRKHRRQHTAHRPQTTVECQLPQKDSLPQQLPRQFLRRVENRQRQSQIVKRCPPSAMSPATTPKSPCCPATPHQNWSPRPESDHATRATQYQAALPNAPQATRARYPPRSPLSARPHH